MRKRRYIAVSFLLTVGFLLAIGAMGNVDYSCGLMHADCIQAGIGLLMCLPQYQFWKMFL